MKDKKFLYEKSVNLLRKFALFSTYQSLKEGDKDRRLLIECWDWDQLTQNDFMGAMSLGISEIIKSPQEGWFKFLTADEGAFYNVPLPPEGEELVDQFKKMRKPSQRVDIDRKISMIRQNTEDQDKIGLNDFNFLRVLGRGSFGKVMLAELKGN